MDTDVAPAEDATALTGKGARPFSTEVMARCGFTVEHVVATAKAVRARATDDQRSA
jgi:hypothetical protein